MSINKHYWFYVHTCKRNLTSPGKCVFQLYIENILQAAEDATVLYLFNIILPHPFIKG